MYPWSKAVEENRQVRQAPIQAAQPDRDHVWQAQGLAACGNLIRPLSHSTPLGYRTGCDRHLPAVKTNESRP